MSTLTDQIVKVLRLHGDTCTRANADYLAARIAEALQLTEEQRTIGTVWTGVDYANVNERRWVSAWSRADESVP